MSCYYFNIYILLSVDMAIMADVVYLRYYFDRFGLIPLVVVFYSCLLFSIGIFN